MEETFFSNFAYLPERPDPDDENQQLSAERKDDSATVIPKFDKFFNQRDPQLMLHEQYWLHLQREQSQTFDPWVRTLTEMASVCKSDNVDIMVRDKLVFSCRDDLSKLKLYDMGAGLTLRKITEILFNAQVDKERDSRCLGSYYRHSCHQT